MNNLFWQPGMTLKDLEREAVKASLQFFKGNQQSAASALGITEAEMTKKVEENDQRDRDSAESEYTSRQQRDKFLRRQRGLPEDDTTAQVASGNGTNAQAGMGVQSAANPGAKSPVSVSVGKEVQGVSPQHSRGARSGKGR